MRIIYTIIVALLPNIAFSLPPTGSLNMTITGVPSYSCRVDFRQVNLDNVAKASTVAQIKGKIQEYAKLPVEYQQLFIAGKEYSDETTLESIPDIDNQKKIILQIKYPKK